MKKEKNVFYDNLISSMQPKGKTHYATISGHTYAHTLPKPG